MKKLLSFVTLSTLALSCMQVKNKEQIAEPGSAVKNTAIPKIQEVVTPYLQCTMAGEIRSEFSHHNMRVDLISFPAALMNHKVYELVFNLDAQENRLRFKSPFNNSSPFIGLWEMDLEFASPPTIKIESGKFQLTHNGALFDYHCVAGPVAAAEPNQLSGHSLAFDCRSPNDSLITKIFKSEETDSYSAIVYQASYSERTLFYILTNGKASSGADFNAQPRIEFLYGADDGGTPSESEKATIMLDKSANNEYEGFFFLAPNLSEVESVVMCD